MINVWSYILRYKIPASIALFFMLVELIVELFQPLLMARIINEGVMEKDTGVIFFWGGVLLSLSILAFLSGIMNSFYAAHAGQSYGLYVRKQVFNHIQSFSYSQFSLFPSGSLMTRLTNDIQQLQNAVFMLLRIMARAPLLVIGGLVMAFIVHPKLAIFLAAVVPVLFLFMVYVLTKGSRMFTIVQQKLDKVNTVMGENLAGMKLIRAFRRKQYEEGRFDEANADLKKTTESVLRFMEITMPALLLVMNTMIVCILWFGRAEMTAGTANVGEVVAVLNYGTRITSALSVFTFIIMAFSRAKASAGRLNEVMRVEPSMEDKEDAMEPDVIHGEIRFEKVSFRYAGQEMEALQDVSFRVAPGKTIAILGATGSGKSTLLHLIPRLYEATGGTVYIDGIDVREMKQEVLRRNIGIVPQEALLFSGTVKDNLLWGNRNASDDEITKAAENAQILSMIEHLPAGFDTVIGQKGVNVSGGQRQRLSIARALVRKPAILLFDDSTSALDMNTEKKLLKALRSYSGTKVMVTQKISTAMQADQILLLRDGKVEAAGTHEYLKSHSVMYGEILESQMQTGGKNNAVQTNH